MIDLEFVRGLIEAVDRSGIDTLEVSRAGTRIRIAKTPPAAAVVAGGGGGGGNSTGHASAPVDVQVSGSPQTAGASAEPAPSAPSASNLIDVRSPMVGTFYRAPSPEAPPYVEIGSRISKGQTLCILEAMKLMNELESEVSGVVREVLIENAEPVEYGQVLFRVEPAS